MTEYFNLVDHIDITCIVEELDMCPELAWTEVQEWVNPQADKIHDLYQKGIIPDKDQFLQRLARAKYYAAHPDVSKEQDRLHLIWQMTNLSNNAVWWMTKSWRNQIPSINPTYGKYFNQTIQLMTQYWAAQEKKLSRLFFSRLTPGKQVYPHRDGSRGNNYENIERYGLIISTNSQCELTVGSLTVNPDPGTLFWIDGTVIHSAINAATASSPRVFLYMDVDVCPDTVDK
jgi:hypothetical protein